MVRVLIAEDNEIVRRGLAALLENEPELSVAGQAENGRQALELLRSGVTYDVLLADLNMPDMDGLQLTIAVKTAFPEIKMVILTMHAKLNFAERAREAGVSGFLLKQLDPEELADALGRIAGGEEIF